MIWRIVIPLALILVTIFAAVGWAAVTPSDNSPTPAQLKAKIRAQQNRISDLNDQIDAQGAVITDQTQTISRLRARFANQPSAIDVITSGDPDELWTSMRAIWAVFPRLPDGSLCGYDKANTSSDVGISLDTYTFYRWAGC